MPDPLGRPRQAPYNGRVMPTTLLLPGALLPPALAADLARTAGTPHLHRILSRGASETVAADPFSLHCTPDEAWLAARLGLEPPFPQAACAAHAVLDATTQAVWAADLCHLRLATDHLVLTELGDAAPAPDEAAALRASAEPVLADEGVEILAARSDRWFLRLPAHWDIRSFTPACALGRNVDAWMPQGRDARAWRRVLNALQMDWHAHPVNAEREARGLPTVNSVWLHGGPAVRPPRPAYARVVGPAPWLRGLAAWMGAGHAESGPLAPGTLLVDTTPQAAVEAEDWYGWQAALRTLDEAILGPALAALPAGEALEVVLTGEANWRVVRYTRRDAMRFWRRPAWDRVAEPA